MQRAARVSRVRPGTLLQGYAKRVTQELALAGYGGRSPFHAETVVFKGLDLETLLECHRLAFSLLTSETSHSPYMEVQDWHEHDGIVTDGHPLELRVWASRLESPRTLAEAWRAEDYCHRTVYPADLSWCLRYKLWEDLGEKANHMEMDFSGDSDVVTALAEVVRDRLAVDGKVSKSTDWFQESGQTLEPQERPPGKPAVPCEH